MILFEFAIPTIVAALAFIFVVIPWTGVLVQKNASAIYLLALIFAFSVYICFGPKLQQKITEYTIKLKQIPLWKIATLILGLFSLAGVLWHKR